MVLNPTDAGPPAPEPVTERPPDDRFCDLILNGGVASGVVYPWAIVELARHYRFRSIGGNSVGAMAAALAAAAEYGRCWGQTNSFEVLRRTPEDLAEEMDGRSQMLRLFQPSPGLRRLFECFLIGVRHLNAPKHQRSRFPWLLTLRDVLGQYGLGGLWLLGSLLLLLPAIALSSHPVQWAGLVLLAAGGLVAAEFAARGRQSPGRAWIVIALVAFVVLAHATAAVFLSWRLATSSVPQWWGWSGLLPALGVLGWTVVVLAVWALRLWPELRTFKENRFGLCTGKAQPATPGAQPTDKALVEWLHEGIQRAAGRERESRPLTFAELWSAPRGAALAAGCESISLEMFSTNVTLARPVSWPLRDRNTRLFFRREDWEHIFPPTLLNAAWDAAKPYAPHAPRDPRPGKETEGLREVPCGDLPIAIAARLSLSFPLLFSCVQVWAIDYEHPSGAVLRPCLLTDGGVCTNFPIHLFDAAHPQWPTFGLQLSRRRETHRNRSIWLPRLHLEGREDNWLRDMPEKGKSAGLLGLLFGIVSTALDWNDSLTSRLPHVRNRVLRMDLRSGEGQLNIAMPGRTILHMAAEYGTAGGRELVRRFVAEAGKPARAWQEHLYVRALNQLRALGEHLRGYASDVTAAGFTQPLADVLAAAVRDRPLDGGLTDLAGDPLGPDAQRALQEAVGAVAALAELLERCQPRFGPYQPVPPATIRMRSM